MPQFYAEILRSVGYRDNNFKPLASNDPSTSTISWTVTTGQATSDGDIITLNNNGVGPIITSPTIPGSLSTNTYPYLVIRGKIGAGVISLDVIVNYTSGSSSFSGLITSSSYVTVSKQLTAGKTISNIEIVSNDTGFGQKCFVDYVYICGKTQLQLSQKDLVSGTVTRSSLGNDHAELKLNNWQGKFTPNIFGTTGANAIGYGDHLHIYLGQAATLFHVYGGYVELAEPTHPNDEILVHSRGFGLALLRSKVLQIYNSTTPQGIINDMLDNFVNAANKNGIGASNYQLTRSFVQNIGSSIPLYVTQLNHAYNSIHELADLTVFQGTPAIFSVDPAENLHWVPLGTQGAANWTTDPFSASYGTTIAYGTNLSTSRLTRDSQSLVNRVHYYGIAQVPGQVDGITEYSTDGAMQTDWDVERLNTDTVVDLHTVSSPVAIGGHSNQFHFHSGGGSGGNTYTGAMIYPKTHTSTFIDFTKLGSQWSPPVLEMYFRVHPNAPATFGMGQPSSVFFANDASNRYEYFLPGDGTNSVLNVGTPLNDNWYHLLVPVGPNAGNLFLSAPAPNIVPQPTLLTPQYQNKVGSPNWATIKYFGLYNGNTNANDSNASTLDIYIDGVRFVGGRYRLAYDSTKAYPDMSEAYYYDPVSKDETAIKAFAGAELLKLRKPILRGSVVFPVLADIVPEQQVKVNIPSANLSSQFLRCTSVIHHFSPNGYLTELALTDDFTNSRPLDQWKLMNMLLEMGENAIFSRQLYDLRSAVLDPTFTPIVDSY